MLGGDKVTGVECVKGIGMYREGSCLACFIVVKEYRGLSPL